MDTSILQDAISLEQLHGEIEKNLVSLEYLENSLNFTASLEHRVDSGEISMEDATEQLKLVTQDLSLEASIFQKGSPVHRLIASVMQAIRNIINKTKDLINKLFSSREKLRRKAEEIKKVIRNKPMDDEWVGKPVDIGLHSTTLMNGKMSLGVTDIMDSVFRQSMSANSLAANTNRYIDNFDYIANRAERDVHWAGDSGELDELFENYIERVGYNERDESFAGLPIDEPLLGSKIISVTTEYDDDGKYICNVALKSIPNVKPKRFNSLSHRSAMALCDLVIDTLKDDRQYNATRSELNKSMGKYRDAVDRLYKVFYQSGMKKEIGDSMVSRVRSITQRDICRDVVKLVIDLDKNVYRSCLTSLIWIDKSLDKTKK